MKRNVSRSLIIVLLFSFVWGCNIQNEEDNSLMNPVLPGDRPNPTITKIDDTYYASATSSEWSPLFPIYKSTDLSKWELISYVFPGGAPDWAKNNFWAPELSYDEKQQKLYVYYTARDKEANQVCVAVAAADSPDGPFTDFGPLIKHENGVIDPFEVRDENGNLYLIWKEGYVVGKPSTIWGQSISEDRTKITGEKHELIRNDCDWEEHTVEGPCVYRKGDYFYLFYSAGNCCDISCNYKIGVARSKSLLGKWEKSDNNPIMVDGINWKCPGTGNVFDFKNDQYLLLHAYHTKNGDFIGREGVLCKLNWTEDNWPSLENIASNELNPEMIDFESDFSGALDLCWQWRTTQKLSYATGEDGLMLAASNENNSIGSMLVQPIKSIDFELKATIDLSNTGENVTGGIALIGGSDNSYGSPIAGLGISVSQNLAEVWVNSDAEKNVIEAVPVLKTNDQAEIMLELFDGHLLRFSLFDGNYWQTISDSVDASSFVPWGMGFRLGIVSQGNSDEFVNIRKLSIKNS
ncbi:family 43 glycosylhydrolase [Sunxiuqinia sp. A32]|uniref:family 43 glycosylhydrolase n=1 Tax=Sunxiuqinia sp. A32 TaxID=3461496 RepID=UPI00404561AD